MKTISFLGATFIFFLASPVYAGIVITPILEDQVIEKTPEDCFFGVVTPQGCGYVASRTLLPRCSTSALLTKDLCYPGSSEARLHHSTQCTIQYPMFQAIFQNVPGEGRRSRGGIQEYSSSCEMIDTALMLRLKRGSPSCGLYVLV
jgi:hypothetical protein